MTKLINDYTKSCFMVKRRISELTRMRDSLMKSGNILRVRELDLDRRIELLYEEHGEMQAVIAHLTAYKRRREGIVET
ncbi:MULTISPECIES: hypothetical protein [Ruminococcus]|uniref:Uncharacterized protein n=1 Tax=Ruminococcus flavefaciens TaxID=1265 RepID=A0A1M7MSG9_RUMFL|nr:MULTISPECIES: hypothetical protein [Ruminococcus]MCR4638730.1 hypothetical protein [Ruminococcus sp.]SHM93956.1 hypothetical protein SAMN04487860_1287 [Ruminococcus flavefaciens]